MRTPEQIARDDLRPGQRSRTGGRSTATVAGTDGGTAPAQHDQVLKITSDTPDVSQALRFRVTGANRGFRHGVFRRKGGF